MEELRGCATCAYTMKKCEGDCSKCERGIARDDGDYDCKCIECYDERAEVYRYYKPSEELLALLGREHNGNI